MRVGVRAHTLINSQLTHIATATAHARSDAHRPVAEAKSGRVVTSATTASC